MDSVRFGRVLGVGARLAGKTLAEAVDAATSPAPSTNKPASALGSTPRNAVILPAKHAGVRTVRQARASTEGVRRGGKRFGEAMWGPVARASGVLWLEVTGVFFGLITVLGLDGMWINRGVIHWRASGHDMREHFTIGAVVALLFGYFAASSFVRAARRTRSYR